MILYHGSNVIVSQPRLVEQRRDFHKYAESGWFEMRTSSIIARKLTDLGYEVLTGDDVCDRDARMGVPSEEALEAHYQKALSQGVALGDDADLLGSKCIAIEQDAVGLGLSAALAAHAGAAQLLFDIGGKGHILFPSSVIT